MGAVATGREAALPEPELSTGGAEAGGRKSISLIAARSCLTLVTPWTITHQAPLSMGFSRQEY